MIHSIYCPADVTFEEAFADLRSQPSGYPVLFDAKALMHWHETVFSADQLPETAVWASLSLAEIEDEPFLDALIATGASTFVVRGVCGLPDIEKASVLLTVAECRAGKPDGSVSILAAPCDSGKAVMMLPRDAIGLPRLKGLLFDGDRLASDLGLRIKAGGGYASASVVTTARDLTVLSARSCGVPAYACVCHSDRDAALAEIADLAANGFGGAVTSDIRLLSAIQLLFGDQS